MAKLTLADVSNISGAEATAISTINSNSAAIEAALEKTLSRDGTSPNSMSADLDMNSNDILNVNELRASEVYIGDTAFSTYVYSAAQAAAVQTAIEAIQTEVETTQAEILVTQTEVEATAAGVDTAIADAIAEIEQAAPSFNTVALLLADTSLAYTAGVDKTVVAAGDEVFAQGFRYTVAASGATDNHVVTAGGVKLYVSPWDRKYNALAFGAVGDNSTNDYTALDMMAEVLIAQAATAPVTGVFPAGYTFLTAGTIEIGSKVTLEGGGTLAVHPSMPDTSPLLASRTRSATLNTWANSDVEIRDLTFDGKDKAVAEVATTQNLLRLDSIDGLKIYNCTFKDHRRGLIAAFGCKDFYIYNNVFALWGFLTPGAGTGDGGSAIFVSKNYTDLTEGRSGFIYSNSFNGGRWTAISAYTNNTEIFGNTIVNGKECGIFIRRDAGGGTAIGINCYGNVIRAIRQNYVDAAGIVFTAERGACYNNVVEDCDAAGISLGTAAKTISISNNQVTNCVRSSVTHAGLGQISLRDDITASDHPIDVSIVGNVVRDTAGTRIAPYGIRVNAVNGSAAARTGLVVTGNVVLGAAASADNNIAFDSAMAGGNSMVGDNMGSQIRRGNAASQLITRFGTTVDFPSISAGSFQIVSVTVPSGVTVAEYDIVSVGLPPSAFSNTLNLTAYVFDSSTIRIKAHNYGGASVDPSALFCAFEVRR